MAKIDLESYKKVVEDVLQATFIELREGAVFQNVTLAIASRIALAVKVWEEAHTEKYLLLLDLVKRLDVEDVFFGVPADNVFGEWDLGHCTYCGVGPNWVHDGVSVDRFDRQRLKGHHEMHHKEDCVVLALRQFLNEE